GDLRHANYPLALGHYSRDVIVNAEAALDAALGGVLRQRFDLGIYAGEIGTSEIVLDGVRPPGAIVVGLGPVGELTPERLRLSFATALRRYAVAVAERKTMSDGGKRRSAAFSSVFVGTDGGGVGGQIDSIHAIIRAAIDANRSLKEARLDEKVRIDAIEFVELYEDVAIRAAHVLGDLPGPLAQELKDAEVVEGDPRVIVRPGGRFLRPADPYASGWWQRIGVQRKSQEGTPAGIPADTTTALQFTVLTDRARLEQDVSVGQRALIQQLVTGATGRTVFDPELSAALYRLIVPPPVIDRISRGGDLLFMVDRTGAGYPYELMAEHGRNGPQPLAQSRGVLRQFETSVYRVQPEMARAPQIFIVGNPKTFLWPSLAGAEQEATEVKEIAEKYQLTAVTAPREDADRTIVKLLTGEFRVLHFAAHGQFDPDPMKSGVVVGDRTFITPDLVGRLPLVPELVFLNCCYLGTMGEARPSGPDPRLAASLAEGFIRAGVRAIVAAGWAVSDEAGRTFARTFYEKFLGGGTFGDAVKDARDAARKNHPEFNTWGAYQCYGNPDYRFQLQRDGNQSAGRSAKRFVARSEALQAYRTLASNARSMRLGEVDRLTREFEALREDTAKWAGDGEVQGTCGEICGELEDFERAIEFYRNALKAVPATVPFQSAEQLANLLSRSAAMRYGESGTIGDALQRFDEASSWLDWLEKMLGPSSERFALRGALYKRWAICDAAHRQERAGQSRDAYAEAAKLAKKSYQDLNALALAFVNRSAKELAQLQADIDERRGKLGEDESKGDRDFWDLVAGPDTLLHWQVIHGSLASGSAYADLLQGYERARRAGPSPRQWASVLDHIWFLEVMLGDSRLQCTDATTAAKLGELLAALGRPAKRRASP
ncbi:MAG TPA: CHAT domain-containing protein, partial [Burkholderiales bacterium]|nr:CHAT domain-containing protein [Burkholderiales bacterium]